MAAAPLADRLRHMIEAIDRLTMLWSGKGFRDYLADPILAAASERFLEKVCEAATYIPAERKARHAHIPWEQIRGLGNRLRHAYDDIDPQIIWAIIEQDLMPLRAACEAMLKEERTRGGP
jgi:uncharacterized protein with HEPN domain